METLKLKFILSFCYTCPQQPSKTIAGHFSVLDLLPSDILCPEQRPQDPCRPYISPGVQTLSWGTDASAPLSASSPCHPRADTHSSQLLIFLYSLARHIGRTLRPQFVFPIVGPSPISSKSQRGQLLPILKLQALQIKSLPFSPITILLGPALPKSLHLVR